MRACSGLSGSWQPVRKSAMPCWRSGCVVMASLQGRSSDSIGVIMQGWSAVMRCRIRIEMKQAC